MQIYGASQVHGPQSIAAPHTSRIGGGYSAPRTSAPTDEVQISSVGQFLDRISDLPEIRTSRVEQLRQAISQGNYDSDDKLELALDRLLNEIA
jgi:negative regulator of flagellin synthesis FlgM